MANIIELIAIKEMEPIPNLELFNIDDNVIISKEIIKDDINKYKNKIKSINLIDISGWAKTEMINYKIDDNIFETFSLETKYTDGLRKIIQIKLDNLPSHIHIVERSLYTFIVYDTNDDLINIYLTIQGCAFE